MFDVYFCRRVCSRLRSGPNAALLEAFVVHLDLRKHSRLTTQNYVRAAELFLGWLCQKRRPMSTVTESVVRRFAGRGRPGKQPRANSHAALRELLRFLRQRGIVPARPSQTPRAVTRIVAAYDAHLCDAAGLASATRLYRRRYACEFISSVFGTGHVRWSRVRPRHVCSFVAAYGRRGHHAAAQGAAISLRSLLRWLQFCGHVQTDLIAAIPSFRRWRHTALPLPLTDEQYRTLLATFDRTTPVGRRDYALAVCLGDLGLRVGEVADVMIDNLDLMACTVQIIAGKSRHGRVLPLPERVRQAIEKYIQSGRPSSNDPHVFLRHRSPGSIGVSRELVRGVVRRAFAMVAGCEQQNGTHVLRRTAATRLHRAGADLKHVADLLGHRSIDTTAIYAKVDHERLSAVAMPWPTSKEVQS
jgi:site-specific recombinase XerD